MEKESPIIDRLPGLGASKIPTNLSQSLAIVLRKISNICLYALRRLLFKGSLKETER